MLLGAATGLGSGATMSMAVDLAPEGFRGFFRDAIGGFIIESLTRHMKGLFPLRYEASL